MNSNFADRRPLSVRDRVNAIKQRYYPHYEDLTLRHWVLEASAPGLNVLEIGCGDGRHSPQLRGRVGLYAGIDPDPRVLTNPKLDDARLGSAENLPWPDETFDLVFHHMVAEHLSDPVAVMRETARVLKPGGILIFETPNRWHYAMIVAAITPLWFHRWWLHWSGSRRKVDDTFPTFYRLNSTRQIVSTLAAASLTGEIHYQSAPPGYLSFHPVSYLAGVLYERTVERIFPRLRATIRVKAQKPWQ